MASVTFSDLWVSNPYDPTLTYRWYLSDLSATPSKVGGVRRLANGRLRAVTRAGTAQSIKATIVAIDRTTVEQVEAWQGLTVLVRDPVGRRFYATYFEPDITEDPSGSGVAIIKLTLHEVTVTES